MIENLFPSFLDDPEQYELSERFWQELWCRIDPTVRLNFKWSHPWLGTGSPTIKDGNPIFSAYSPVLGRGIRVIQEEPVGLGLDIRAWLDTFGGDITDPDRIHELVIACTLSDVASNAAFFIISQWVQGQSISFRHDNAGLFLPSNSQRPGRMSKSLGIAA